VTVSTRLALVLVSSQPRDGSSTIAATRFLPADANVPIALRTSREAVTAPRARVDHAGWLDRAPRVHSPNRDDRPPATEVTLLVVHGISLPPGRFGGDGVQRLFTNRLDANAHPSFDGLRGLRVSAHFFVRRSGALLQFVSCEARAWHAGTSSWKGRERCNDFSIGVELEGTDARAYTARQYARLAGLVRSLLTRYPLRDVVGHSDIAPGRKTDPGPSFDWARLRALLQARGVGTR
jgi:AmpD protein